MQELFPEPEKLPGGGKKQMLQYPAPSAEKPFRFFTFST
jgi:hypothetical protein